MPDARLRVLAIDGGGIRAILPARILVELERLAGQPAAALFDLIAASSASALLALGLSLPSTDDRPAHSAEHMFSLYVDRGPDLYPRTSLLSRLRGAESWTARYSTRNLDALLEPHLGGIQFGAARCAVAIPCFDLRRGEPMILRSLDFEGSTRLEMREVAKVSMAAPGHFPPVSLDFGPDSARLIDGSLFAGNPWSLACAEALRGAPRDGGQKIVLLSLGTGRAHRLSRDTARRHLALRRRFRSSPDLAAILAHASIATNERLAAGLLGPLAVRYWRVQADLPECDMRPDAADDGNRGVLEAAAEHHAEDHRSTLEDVLDALVV